MIVGPMFAGKSTELLRQMRRYEHAGRRCIVVKFEGDTRYDEESDQGDSCETYISTHDERNVMKAVKSGYLKDMKSVVRSVDVIGIDEGQFFPDLLEFCEDAANMGKTVIVAALDGTYRRDPFGSVCDLIPKCESVVKLTSVCVECGGIAPFTKRTSAETEVTLIGGKEHYAPVCRKHYFQT